MKKILFIAKLATIIAISIVAAPVQTNATSQKFTDVGRDFWAYEEIMDMQKDHIINGYPDNTFKPNALINRTHVAALFSRSMDLTPIRPGKEFKDVPKTHLYYKEIQEVYRAGIFDGKENNTFGVNDQLTRAHMAKILHIAFDFETHTKNVFTDIKDDYWAKDHIATLYANNITASGGGKFNPDGYVSRAHYAVFLDRALKASVSEIPPTQETDNPIYIQRVKEIQNKWTALKPSYKGPIMAEEASTVSPYRLGKVHQKELADALNLTNFIRFTSYLPSNIKLNDSFNKEAQAASVVNAANQLMTHTPVKPVGMDDALFKLGYSGANSSNIGVGYLDIKKSIQIGYMPDYSDSNRASVGHRRWILSPSLQEVGFGYATDKDGRGHTAMKVIADKMWENPSAPYDMITWPAKTAFPTAFFGPRDPWSVSLNTDVYDAANVKQINVQLTRVADGKKWIFNQTSKTDGFFTIDTANYGQTPYTIIFQPNGIAEYRQGDHYEVEISNVYKKGGQKTNVQFETTFFDLQ